MYVLRLGYILPFRYLVHETLWGLMPCNIGGRGYSQLITYGPSVILNYHVLLLECWVRRPGTFVTRRVMTHSHDEHNNKQLTDIMIDYIY